MCREDGEPIDFLSIIRMKQFHSYCTILPIVLFRNLRVLSAFHVAEHLLVGGRLHSAFSFDTLPSRSRLTHLAMGSEDNTETIGKSGTKANEFWTRQKQLAADIKERAGRSLKDEQREKFVRRRIALVGDTAYIGFAIFCALWFFSSNPFVALSYAFGATMGLAYAFGLGKYVETLGGSMEDKESLKGAGLGEARFAFLIILFIFVGKFRDQGLLEIPSITGFFTYQLASLVQGLREITD